MALPKVKKFRSAMEEKKFEVVNHDLGKVVSILQLNDQTVILGMENRKIIITNPEDFKQSIKELETLEPV
jgi:flagellin-specific chaperone FliS